MDNNLMESLLSTPPLSEGSPDMARNLLTELGFHETSCAGSIGAELRKYNRQRNSCTCTSVQNCFKFLTEANFLK